MNTAKPTIGFIGLGIMGAPMARNLVAAGYELTVLDVVQADRPRPGARRRGLMASELVNEEGAAAGLAGDGPQVVRRNGHRFLSTGRLQVVDHRIEIDPFQIVPLAAGQDGNWDFMGFRRGKEKQDMFRWFFEGLKKSIESGKRQHMHFIDDDKIIIGRAEVQAFHPVVQLLHRCEYGPVLRWVIFRNP